MVSVLATLILALVKYPWVQEKVQAELEAIIGRGQLPDFSFMDDASLPYLAAVIKEVLRWQVATLLCPSSLLSFRVPHG